VRFDVAAVAEEARTAAERGLGAGGRLEGARLADAPADSDGDGSTVLRDLAAADGTSYRFQVRTGPDGPRTVLLQPKRYCFEEPWRRPFAYAPPRVIDVSACRR
jgi:hypothetical protein